MTHQYTVTRALRTGDTETFGPFNDRQAAEEFAVLEGNKGYETQIGMLFPMIPMSNCYVCDTEVATVVAKRIADELDKDMARTEAVTDCYGLVHCTGPASQFLEDGRVVLCQHHSYAYNTHILGVTLTMHTEFDAGQAHQWLADRLQSVENNGPTGTRISLQ